MFRATLVLLASASTLLIGSLTAYGTAQTSKPYLADTDHITFFGPDSSVQDQVRYLIENWPYDFEIAVIEPLGEPQCNHPSSGACRVKVKPVELILGHQTEASFFLWYGPAKHCKNNADPCAYVFDRLHFDVKSGQRMVAMFTPIIRGPHQPIAYTATRLDHVHDSLVESVRKAVAENLMAGEHCEAKP
jgi:hypothetical protein